MPWLELSALIIVLYSALTLRKWWQIRKLRKLGLPPGPALPLPGLGDLLLAGANVLGSFEYFHRRYGDIYCIHVGPIRFVVISNYALLQEASHHEAFNGRPTFEYAKELRGAAPHEDMPGIIFSSGKTWTEQRRFTMHALKDLGFGKGTMEDIIEEEAGDFCARLEGDGDHVVDFRHRFNLSVTNSMWRLATGERLRHDDPDVAAAIDNMDQFTALGGNPLVLVALFVKPLAVLLDRLGLHTIQKAVHSLSKFTSDAVAVSTKRKSDEDNKSERASDFIDAYLQQMKASSDPDSTFFGHRGVSNLSNVLFDLFVAGNETTSNTLTWSMLFMAKNPSVQARVQRELDEVVGRERLPRWADHAATPYTQAVITEVLRRSCVLSEGVAHFATGDIRLAGGKYLIPKGSVVVPNLYAMMHNPADFPSPREFSPERHLDANDGSFAPHAHVLPFGTGKRKCAGENVAKMQLFVFFSSVLQRFTVEAVDPDLSDEPVVGLTRAPRPFSVMLKKR